MQRGPSRPVLQTGEQNGDAAARARHEATRGHDADRAPAAFGLEAIFEIALDVEACVSRHTTAPPPSQTGAATARRCVAQAGGSLKSGRAGVV
jgi:hypothetical protein